MMSFCRDAGLALWKWETIVGVMRGERTAIANHDITCNISHVRNRYEQSQDRTSNARRKRRIAIF